MISVPFAMLIGLTGGIKGKMEQGLSLLWFAKLDIMIHLQVAGHSIRLLLHPLGNEIECLACGNEGICLLGQVY